TLGTSAQCPPSVSSCVPPTSNGVATEILAPDIPDSLAQASGSLGGAIVTDRTHYFAAFDYTHQHRTAPITTPIVPPGTTSIGNYRRGLFDARADHGISSEHSLTLRVSVDRFSDTNPQAVVSGNTLPSAARVFTGPSWSAQSNETAI